MKKKIITCLFVALSTQFIHSQNYNDALLLSEPGIYYGARALSFGNSFTSLSDDFSGVLFNPAGMERPALHYSSPLFQVGVGHAVILQSNPSSKPCVHNKYDEISYAKETV